MGSTEFHFDKNYKNTEQVRTFMDAFLARYAEIVASGQYPYNASFVGHIGVTGDEETAVYLCQTLKDLDEIAAKVKSALANGYVPVESVNPGADIRCESVIHYAFYMGGTGWRETNDVRLVHGLTGLALMKPRARTRGVNLMGGHVLIKKINR